MDTETVNIPINTKAKTAGAKQAQSALDKLAKSAQSVKTGWTELNSAFAMGQRVIQGVGKAIDATVGEFVDYAMQVRDMAQMTGMAADETSRLIQVADDLGVSQQSLGSAMEAAVRKGVTPTIDNIAKLSDEYLKLAPGLERSKFLMDNFGRSGVDLQRIMELGSAEIRSQTAAIADSMVVTEDAIRMADEYRMSVDNLGDSFTAFKYELAKEAIPALNDLMTGMTNNMRVANLLGDVMKNSNYNIWSGTKALSKAYKVWFEDIDNVTLGYIKLGKQLEVNKAKSSSLMGMSAFDPNTWRKVAEGIDTTTEALEDNAQAIKANEQALSDLSTMMDGAVGKENAAFERSLNDLQNEAGELLFKIRGLESVDMLTEEQQGDLWSLQNEFDTTQQKIADLRAEHDQTTKAIIFNILQTQMAAQGFNDAAVLADIAMKWGLIDQATKDVMTTTSAWSTQALPVGKVDEEEVLALERLLWELAKGVTIPIAATIPPWLQHALWTGSPIPPYSAPTGGTPPPYSAPTGGGGYSGTTYNFNGGINMGRGGSSVAQAQLFMAEIGRAARRAQLAGSFAIGG